MHNPFHNEAKSHSILHVNLFEIIALNDKIFCSFEICPNVTNILLTRDYTLHRISIYLPKNGSSIFKHNFKVFRNSP